MPKLEHNYFADARRQIGIQAWKMGVSASDLTAPDVALMRDQILKRRFTEGKCPKKSR